MTTDHDRQLRQEHTRRGFAEVLLGDLLRQVLEVHVAVVDEDRLGDAVLTHHPLGHLVVATDEVLEGVFLHHPAHADLAGLAAHDFRGDSLGCVAGNVRQFRLGQFQRRGRCAADGVGLGLLQFLGHGCRLGRLHIGEGSRAGQQHRAGQQADRAFSGWMIHLGDSLRNVHQKRQITSMNARCMYESTSLPYASPGLNTPPRKRTRAEGSSIA
ncbi:hypothetical protein D3C78_876570 [compost metagenome]